MFKRIPASELAKLRSYFKAGAEVMLLTPMTNDPNPVSVGSKGIVNHIDDLGTVFVEWENEGKLGCVWGTDHFALVSDLMELSINELLNDANQIINHQQVGTIEPLLTYLDDAITQLEARNTANIAFIDHMENNMQASMCFDTLYEDFPIEEWQRALAVAQENNNEKLMLALGRFQGFKLITHETRYL
ncbi:DUF4314 domain-containing protein [Enterovibrio norvegicus]|uniref:DUF4314 domain-containing protein n=1 Tax=Enterovibrio norvegicus TaxID=188144 RepID=UPI000C855BAB|nr:DUF4314 domain-containing protein [Enterovibrio norvegicus]PMH64548.1 hypothetical protein BCU62_15955 [Enterovibrio norvegicus]